MRVAINLLTDDPAHPSGAHWFWTRVIPGMAARLAEGLARVPDARRILWLEKDRRAVPGSRGAGGEGRMSAFENPVLLVIYRRPELTRRVFDVIAKARPKRLFIAADGPATSAEREACDLARAAVRQVDWDCKVQHDFSDANLGLDRRMISALGWVFSEEESAIVLEASIYLD